MTADRVRVPNQRNVRSLALHRHGQSHVAEPFTVRSLNPELDVDRLDGTVLPHARGRERERKRTRRRNLSFDLRGGSLPDSPLSPRGVLRLVPDSPNSTLLGNLPRTLPKREPRRGYAKCFGQRFEYVYASLAALLDVGDRTVVHANLPRKCDLGKSAFNSQRLNSGSHAFSRGRWLVGRLFAEPVPQPARVDAKGCGQTRDGADRRNALAGLDIGRGL